VSPTTATNAQNTSLSSGQSLKVNQYLLSPDRQSTLNLQGDGNLVLYSDFLPVWANYIANSAVNSLNMQPDGNLVEYDSSNKPLWASNTSGNPGAYLTTQTDGNLVLYSSTNQPLWQSNTVSVPNHLSRINNSLAIGKIYINQSLETADRNYQLMMQGDGNLVLYNNSTPIWASMTVGKSVSYLAMQGDGNLVLYNTQGAPVWASYTNGNTGSTLNMQPDGNLVIYNSAWHPIWSTNTSNVK
jgi:hypothetical protein